jgi:hypothetical protein
MPLVAFSIKLERIEESLLYQDKGGGWWVSCVCTLEEDAKGRMVVAQSIPKERYAAGEKGPAVGTWREIGGNNASSGKPAFDLANYKKSPAPEQPPSTAGGTGDAPPCSQMKRRGRHERPAVLPPFRSQVSLRGACYLGN